MSEEIKIEDVEEILSGLWSVKLPDNVFMAEGDILYAQQVNGLALGAYAQEIDLIVLPKLAKPDTITHELVHRLGIRNEFLADLAGSFLLKRSRRKRHGLRSVFMPKRPVKYKECDGCHLCESIIKAKGTHYRLS